MFQKSIFHRSRQEENYQKLIQTIERDRLLDKRGTHFMTFTFPYVVGRNGYVATPFGMSDVSTAQDLIGEWAFRMDRIFLGQNIKKKSLDLRMKWIVIPEVKTKEGEKTPLHFHGVFDVDYRYHDKMRKYGVKFWQNLLRSRFPPPNVIWPKLLDIREIDDCDRHRVVSYSMKQVSTGWNWEHMFEHRDSHPSTLPL